MTTAPVAPLPGPTLLGAVAKLLSAGHGAEGTLTGVADLLYRGLPAQRVTLWLREPRATEFHAIVSPPTDHRPPLRNSTALQALLEAAEPRHYRFNLVHEGERLGMLEATTVEALTPERREVLEIAADILSPYLAAGP